MMILCLDNDNTATPEPAQAETSETPEDPDTHTTAGPQLSSTNQEDTSTQLSISSQKITTGIPSTQNYVVDLEEPTTDNPLSKMTTTSSLINESNITLEVPTEAITMQNLPREVSTTFNSIAITSSKESALNETPSIPLSKDRFTSTESVVVETSTSAPVQPTVKISASSKALIKSAVFGEFFSSQF